MVSSRLRRVLSELPPHDDQVLERLCLASAAVSGTSGAGIMLMTGDVQRGSIWTTDDVAAVIEDLQYELGEGPCVDAYVEQCPVGESDLANPAFTIGALGAGVGAVFGFPLSVGEVRLGSLDLYRVEPGELNADQVEDMGHLADLIAGEMLDLQSEAPEGEVAPELELGADLQHEVHQASGMVAAQAGVAVTEALRLLRAHAVASEQRLADVARQVVHRKLRCGTAGEFT
jgi:GAF domain-containing protein